MIFVGIISLRDKLERLFLHLQASTDLFWAEIRPFSEKTKFWDERKKKIEARIFKFLKK